MRDSENHLWRYYPCRCIGYTCTYKDKKFPLFIQLLLVPCAYKLVETCSTTLWIIVLWSLRFVIFLIFGVINHLVYSNKSTKIFIDALLILIWMLIYYINRKSEPLGMKFEAIAGGVSEIMLFYGITKGWTRYGKYKICKWNKN